MSVVALVLFVIFGSSLYWLSREGVMSGQCLEELGGNETLLEEVRVASPQKLGLVVFLAVLSVLFALLLGAYFMRVSDAKLQGPTLLWFNTGALVASSFILHRARLTAAAEDTKSLLLLASFVGLVFLTGQGVAWTQLHSAGFIARTNAATAFFYLLTGAHGLHIVGGLVALVWVALTLGQDVSQRRQSVDLCAMYWNFLLVVWVAIFSVLLGWEDAFAALCRGAFG